jgi:hypothetical protein
MQLTQRLADRTLGLLNPLMQLLQRLKWLQIKTATAARIRMRIIFRRTIWAFHDYFLIIMDTDEKAAKYQGHFYGSPSLAAGGAGSVLGEATFINWPSCRFDCFRRHPFGCTQSLS